MNEPKLDLGLDLPAPDSPATFAVAGAIRRVTNPTSSPSNPFVGAEPTPQSWWFAWGWELAGVLLGRSLDAATTELLSGAEDDAS